ncbi:MAG: hypothetical protein AABY47_05725 [Pseudomonadota bacterium]
MSVALLWLWVVDAARQTVTDWVGVSVCLAGVVIIVWGSQTT